MDGGSCVLQGPWVNAVLLCLTGSGSNWSSRCHQEVNPQAQPCAVAEVFAYSAILLYNLGGESALKVMHVGLMPAVTVVILNTELRLVS